jgi:flagellin-like hook-associated protein FlgL
LIHVTINQKVISMSISLSAGMRGALSTLQSNQQLVQQAQLRLATGKRVSSALDNPSSYFRAQNLTSRASDLQNLMDDMTQASSVMQATSKGLDSVKSLIDAAKGLVGKASQSGQNNTLTGTLTTALKATDLVAGTAGAGVVGMTSGKLIKLAVNGGTAVTAVTLSATTTVQDVIDGINTNTTLNPNGNGTAIKAALVGGNLQITSSSGQTVALSSDDTDANLKLLLGTKTNEGSAVAAAGTNFVDTTRKSIATQFDDILKQIDQTIQDSSYGGINLLQGQDLKVTFNETGTSSISVKSVNYTANGELGIANSTHSFISNDDVDVASANLKRASDKIAAQSAVFAANQTVIQNRSSFTKSLVDTLNAGSDSLTAADQNQESANLLALNTQQQLAQSTLSLASQANAAITRLF